MSTKQSKAKLDSSELVWDSYPHKLLIYIIDAQNVAPKDSNGKSDPYVIIEHGKFKKQTKIQEETLNPVWNELFFIQADPTVQVKLDMWDHDKIGSDDYMGHVTLDLRTIPEDRVVDLFPPLQPRSHKKKEKISGAIHIRLYHSSARETRPSATSSSPSESGFQFLYRNYKSAFKPGDLIAYSGHGIIPALQKIYSNNPFTSVGMVVYLPNKWTGDVEPYVIEMTRNINKNIDVYSETSVKSGIYIFRLFERFHQFHGANIVHFPLVHPLPQDMYKKMVEKVWDYHKKNGILENLNDSYRYGNYLSQLNSFIRKKKNWPFSKHEKLVEGASFDLVTRLLKESGALTVELSEPSDILKSNLYAPPVLIRQTNGESPLYFNNTTVMPPAPSNTFTAPPVQHESLPVYSPPSHLIHSFQGPPPSPYLSSPSLSSSTASSTFSSPPSSPPPPSQSRQSSVVLSQLEYNMLLSLLDGVVVDDKLVVTKNEFRNKMIEKGLSIFKDESKFEAFYDVLDSDNNGKVDLRELVCGFAVLIDGSADEKLLMAFKAFDKDGDRFIKKSELRTLLSTLMKTANRNNYQSSSQHKDEVVEEFVVQIFAEFDKNNDGKLSIEEFLTAAHNNPAVGNLFLTVSNVAI